MIVGDFPMKMQLRLTLKHQICKKCRLFERPICRKRWQNKAFWTFCGKNAVESCGEILHTERKLQKHSERRVRYEEQNARTL